MIQEPTTRPPAASARATLAEEIRRLCVSAGILDSHALREFSAGVAWHAAGLAARPREDLPRLTARALGSIGRPDAARRVLVLGSGLVRPADWLSAHPRPIWTLDLERLLQREEDRLELALFRGLGVIVEALAPAWDPAGGAGELGLRRAAAAARLLLGPDAAPEAVAVLRRDVRDFCEARLGTLGAARGWARRPRVLFMEPEPA